MSARLAASLVALAVLVTGAVPAVGGYRCLAMGTRMQAPAPCCRHEAQGSTVRAPCCEAYAAPQLQPRRTPPSPELRIQPPTSFAWIILGAPAPPASGGAARTTLRARGRPPGEQLHRLSSILRV